MDGDNEKQPLLYNNNGSSQSQRSAVEESSTSQRGPCATVLLSEFRWRNLQLTHSREDVFYSCQWDWPPIIFVLYRVAVAIYAFTILMTDIIYYNSERHKRFPWPAWLTNWSFFMLTAHMVLAAAITLLMSCERGRCCQRWSLRSSVYSFLPDTELDGTLSAIPPAPMPWYIKLDWLLYNTATVAAIIVTVIFFSALYPTLHPDGGFYWGDATMHMSNSIMVLLDLCLCAIPVRLFHGFYCLLYGLSYCIFSIIYWAVDHDHVLYPKVLDWNHPLPTVGVTIFLAFIVVPLLQLALFGLYRLRICTYKCIYGSTSIY